MAEFKRVLDLQKESINNLLSLYDNLKKLNQDRRDENTLKSYCNRAAEYWTSIQKYHTILKANEVPAEYYEKYAVAANTIEKFKSKVIQFGYSSTEIEKSFTFSDREMESGAAIQDSSSAIQNTKHSVTNVPENSDNNGKSGITSTAENNIAANFEVLTSILKVLSERSINQPKSVDNLQPQKVHIPTFNGLITEFHYFRETMNRMIQNVSWGNIEKFVFLREHLSGDPLNLVKIILMDENAYNKAWEILNKYYDSQRSLVTHNVKLLTDQKFHIKEKNLESLKEFSHKFEAIRANFNQMNVTADQIFAEMVVTRFDAITSSRFEDFIGYTQYTPSLEDISNFLMQETIKFQNQTKRQSQNAHSSSKQNTTRVHITQDSNHEEKKRQCLICESTDHEIFKCPAFITCANKYELLKKFKLCIYCGKHKYDRRKPCRSREFLKCNICSRKHVTELHENEKPEISSSTSMLIDKDNSQQTVQTFVAQQNSRSCSLMPTAIVKIVIGNQQIIPVRALIDQCAERSYISDKLANTLNLKRFKSKEVVKGINNITTHATQYAKIKIRFDDPNLDDLMINTIILPEIAGNIPNMTIQNDDSILKIPLADPDFGTPNKVEILLGNDACFRIFKNNEPIKITENGLIYQSTYFGWVISGSTKTKCISGNGLSTYITLNESSQKLKQNEDLTRKLCEFFSLPESDSENDDVDDYCENLYTTKHYRLPCGRYVVPMPFNINSLELGESYPAARACFLSQERKWQKEPDIYEMSNKFMLEYYHMGHMSPIDINEQQKFDNQQTCYIPYMSIVRKNAYTTKLRNVFNASAKTSNGISLNDTILEGKKMQTKISDIITRGRTFKYQYGADIEKMFRQIMIRPEDQDKLRIVWRHNRLAPLSEFRLTTVTYGTNAAPWQAIRTIHQCADDNAPNQNINEIIKSSFYVDDLLHGADTIYECRKQIEDIVNTLNAGCFPLTKWISNDSKIIDQIPNEKQLIAYKRCEYDTIKILGINSDYNLEFYSINFTLPEEIIYTKTGIASIASSFYDPLGLILPFVMSLRILLRNVWAEGLDWNEELNDSWKKQLDHHISNATILKSIKVRRWIGSSTGDNVELIGFADASKDGQAAVIYSRIKSDGKYIINLIAAKGNVNKIKSKIIIASKQYTIPKLELEALLTLVTLYDSIIKMFSHLKVTFKAYTDSQIVLAWVKNNRVSEKIIRRKVNKILKVINPDQLYYVKSSENPADPASRGLTAIKMAECDLYYNGPYWLKNDDLPTISTIYNDNEAKCLISKSEEIKDMFDRFSSLRLLTKITALILRWKIYKKSAENSCYKRYKSKKDGKYYFHFHGDEIKEAHIRVIKYYQRLYLGQILQNINKGNSMPVQKGHWLYKLSPFVDEHGMIRVGGRLGYADITEDLKHPIAIPESHLKRLIIHDTHLLHMHASNSLMIRIINEKYWIPGLRSSIHHFINSCVTCARWKNHRIQPEMAQLPDVRVNTALPFENIGVDLAGPFHLKSSPLRKSQMIKVWVITFVCMLTKALHLEITSSCDTEHFLAAFDRFSSRRGVPKQVWSDNGKNFIGANRLLTQAWNSISKELQSILATREIKWVFIPRYSPSFGGLWEASVKSLKYFTNRMKNIKNLTFEEFNTLLCKIEALLNSRPITPNPISPFEEAPLTPFHFLTNRAATTTPVTAQGVDQSPLTKKWLEILKIQIHLWKRFQTEYLNQLQKKVKWLKKDREINEGELVIIDDHNTAPGEWKMGKVITTFKDDQGISRKAEVKTKQGSVNIESIKNLIPLNILDFNEELPRPSMRNKPMITPTQVLLVWLSLIAGTKGLNVTSLEPGIHIQPLGNISLIVTNLEFKVDTNYNFTDDVKFIHDHINEFEQFCTQETNITIIDSHCKNLLKTIKINSNFVITSLKNEFNLHKKRKRYIPLGNIVAKIGSKIATKVISKESGKFLLKHSPEILLTTGLVWQGYEISNLERQQLDTEQKLKSISQAFLKTLKTEEEVLEKHLQRMKKTQDQQNFVQAINSYSEATNILIETINNKYKSIKNLEPINELRTYMERNQNNKYFNDVQLPEVDNLFSDASYEIIDGIIIVTYTIPLVNNYIILKYAVISVPLVNNKMLKLPIEENPMLIAVNQTNFAILSKDRKIYSELEWLPLDQCLLSVLKFNKSSVINNCKQYGQYRSEEKIVNLNDEVTVVFARNESTTITCDGKQQTYHQQVLLINTSFKCIIKMGGLKSGAVYGEEKLRLEKQMLNFNIPVVKSADVTIRDDLKETFNNLTQTIATIDHNIKPLHFSIGSTAAIILLIILLVCAVRYYKHKKAQQPWLPEWTGPAIEINTI